MPIKPENKRRYPDNWARIRGEILLRAGNKCEGSPDYPDCHVQNHELGGRDKNGMWHKALPMGEKMLHLEWPKLGDVWWCEDHPERLRIIRIVLTIAHLDHTPENCDQSNLRAWCQRCHLHYDKAHHRRTAVETRRKESGVLELF